MTIFGGDIGIRFMFGFMKKKSGDLENLWDENNQWNSLSVGTQSSLECTFEAGGGSGSALTSFGAGKSGRLLGGGHRNGGQNVGKPNRKSRVLIWVSISGNALVGEDLVAHVAPEAGGGLLGAGAVVAVEVPVLGGHEGGAQRRGTGGPGPDESVGGGRESLI